MSFRFKLGDIVVPRVGKEMESPPGPSKVTGLLLNGYVILQPLDGTPRCPVVEAKDYERFKEEVVKSDN